MMKVGWRPECRWIGCRDTCGYCVNYLCDSVAALLRVNRREHDMKTRSLTLLGTI